MKLPKDQLAETNDLNPILTEMEASLNDLKEEMDSKVEMEDMPSFPSEITVSNLPEVQRVEITNLPEKDDSEQVQTLKDIKEAIAAFSSKDVNLAQVESLLSELIQMSSSEEEIDLRPKFDELKAILTTLNDNVSSIEAPAPFDYIKLAQIIRENVKIRGGGGSAGVEYVKNVAGEQINPATAELQQGITSTGNSTTTPLSSGATFTGTWEQNNYSDALVMLVTDNTGTLYFDFSSNGTNLDSTFPSSGFKIAAGIPEVHRAVKGSRYFRIRIVNDSGAQSYLRAITSFGSFGQLSAPLNQPLSNDTDATVSHSISDETDLMIGKYGTDRYIITKFGQNPLIDTGTVPEDIWNYGGVYTGFPTGSAETVTVTSSATTSDAGLTLFLTGLDANYAIQSETITFNGSGVGVTANTYMRINRAYVVLPKSGQITNVGNLTATHTTTTGNIFFKIVAGTGQTNLALYTIPAGYTGYLKTYRASMADTTANNAQLVFWTREQGKAVRLQRNFTISTDYPFDVRLYSGVSFPEKTDLALRCTYVKNNGASIQASFGILLVKN